MRELIRNTDRKIKDFKSKFPVDQHKVSQLQTIKDLRFDDSKLARISQNDVSLYDDEQDLSWPLMLAKDKDYLNDRIAYCKHVKDDVHNMLHSDLV